MINEAADVSKANTDTSTPTGTQQTRGREKQKTKEGVQELVKSGLPSDLIQA